ncbi:MAG: c-type cytochrome biogenesis protein CcsB [Deltaproteobacteria bacterium]|nr:MAG: c-type cytochrome biogenesis protein CcsB [Deltaproteobacteria bacterium]
MYLSLIIISLAIYFISMAFSFAYLSRPRPNLVKWTAVCLGLGFLVQTLSLAVRFYQSGHFPITNLHESLTFFAWGLALFILIIHNRYRISVLFSFAVPIVVLFMALSLTVPIGPLTLAPILKSIWLPIHVTLAFLGDAIFALTFCVSVMYLIQEYHIKKKKIGKATSLLPSLSLLDQLNYRLLSIGFPLLTLGIITGSIWAEYAWGSYWSWDPKETWSLITWLVYAALLHQRLTVGWRGKKAAWVAIIGFVLVLFTFLGVNLLLSGLHSYGRWS